MLAFGENNHHKVTYAMLAAKHDLAEIIHMCNKFIGQHKDDYGFITQRSDGKIYLHKDPSNFSIEGLVVVDFGQIEYISGLYNAVHYINVTYEFRKYEVVEVYTDGRLITKGMKAPFKHKEMIDEWVESGCAKVIEQSQHPNGRKIWATDTRPTWLADEYRFKPLTKEYSFYIHDDCIHVAESDSLPSGITVIYTAESKKDLSFHMPILNFKDLI